MIKKILKKYMKILAIVFVVFSSVATRTIQAQELDCLAKEKSALCPDEGRSTFYNDKKFEPAWGYHETADPLNASLRSTGWIFIVMMANILNGIETLGDDIYNTVKDFVDSDTVTDMKTKIDVLAYASLSLIIIIVGFLTMKDGMPVLKKALTQFMIAILFVGGVGYIFTTAFETIPLAKSFFEDKQDVTLADQVILGAMVDLEYYKDKLSVGENPDLKNDLTKKELDYLNITASARYEAQPYNPGNWFNRRITGYDDENGYPIVGEYQNGVFGFGKTYIYKYKIDMFETFFILAGLLILMCVLYYKQAGYILDLGVLKMFSTIVAFFSVLNTKMLKEMAKQIGKTVLSIVFLFFSLWLYIKFGSWIATKQINFVTKMILLSLNIGYAIGNNKIIASLFGVDNSMQSNWMQKYFAMRAIGKVGKTIGRVATAPFKFAKNTALPGISKIGGNAYGNYIANKRNAFLTGDKKYSDYDGKKEQKFYSAGYEFEDKNAPHGTKKFFGKSFDSFNEAGRKAYETKFPTGKTMHKRTKDTQDLLKREREMYNNNPGKYTTKDMQEYGNNSIYKDNVQAQQKNGSYKQQQDRLQRVRQQEQQQKQQQQRKQQIMEKTQQKQTQAHNRETSQKIERRRRQLQAEQQQQQRSKQVYKNNGKRTEIVPDFNKRTPVDKKLQREYEAVIKEMKGGK